MNSNLLVVYNDIFAQFNMRLVVENVSDNYDLICKHCYFRDPPRPGTICSLCSLVQKQIFGQIFGTGMTRDIQFRIMDPNLPAPTPDDIAAIASLITNISEAHD